METMHSIRIASPQAHFHLQLTWDDGTAADVDIGDLVRLPAFDALKKQDMFVRAKVAEWGHAVEWPGDVAIGADTLWLRTLKATGREDTATLLDWRTRHGLSLQAAATALGLSRRMVAYYSSGEKSVPRTVLLACKGWEAERAEAA